MRLENVVPVIMWRVKQNETTECCGIVSEAENTLFWIVCEMKNK